MHPWFEVASGAGGAADNIPRMQDQWTRSSFCGHNGNCVEVRLLDDDMVAIRDSKNLGQQPLVITASAYRQLIEKVKRGDI
jgi:hypothetical protein